MKRHMSLLMAFILLFQVCAVLIIPVGAASSLSISSPTDGGAISKSNFTYVKWNSVSGAVGYRITVVNGNTGELYTSERNLWVGNKTKYSISSILEGLPENAYPALKIWVGAMSSSDDYSESDVISYDIIWTTVAEAPLIENGDASNIGSDCVTLDMEIIRNYGISVTEAGFYIGTSSKVNNADTYSFKKSEIEESRGTHTLDITGLEPDTKYYYWAYAVNDVDETISDRSYFYTEECPHNKGTYLSAAYEQVNPLDDTYHERIIGYDERCNVCYEIVNEDVEQDRTTEKHVFDANGICSTKNKGCGYAKECQHKDTTKEYDDPVYKCIDENEHKVTYYYHYICNTCGQRIDDGRYYEQETESHTFRNNECRECGYVRSEELEATVTVSKTAVVVGEYVSVEVSASGGAGGYSYYYYVYVNDIEVNSTSEANESYGYTAGEVGELYFKVIVKDSAGERITLYSDSVTVSPDESATPEIESIQIYSPVEGEYIDRLNPPDMTWKKVDTAVSYVVSLYDEIGNCISTNRCQDTVFQLIGMLPSVASYYEAEVYAYNAKGVKIGYGKTNFYTAGEKPIVATGGVDNISDNSVKLTMSIISEGSSSITKQGFYYGSDIDTITEQFVLAEASSNWLYTSIVDNLDSDTQYYYQAFAVNEQGEGVGSIYAFTANDKGSLMVSPSEFTFAGNASSDTISVNSGSEWTVTVEEGTEWITTGRKYGYLNKNFTVSVDENNTGDVRYGTIKITDKTGSSFITVQQNSDVKSTLSVNTQNFTVDSGKNVLDTIYITSNDAWEVTSRASWIVPSVNEGRFDGSLSLIIQENTTSAVRSGQVVIACGDIECTLTITQKASAKPILSNFTDNYTVGINERFNIRGTISATDSGKLDRITIKLAGNDEALVSVLANGSEIYNLSQLAPFDSAKKPMNNQAGTYVYVIYASADNFISSENEIGRFTVTIVEDTKVDAKVSLFNTLVNTTSLTIKGKIDTLGNDPFEECGVILYDTEKKQLEIQKTMEYPRNNSKTFTAEFTGLKPNMNYYAKCYLIAGGKTYYYPDGTNYISLTTTQCVELTDFTIDPYGAYVSASTVENGVRADKGKEFSFTLIPQPKNAYVNSYSISHNGGAAVSYTQEDNIFRITINELGTYSFTFKVKNDVSSKEKTIGIQVEEDDGMVYFRFPSTSNEAVSTGIGNYYNDSFFSGSSYTRYRHDLAKVALGLAVSAYTADTTYYGTVPTEPGDDSYSDGNGTYSDYEKRIANIAYAYEQMGIEKSDIEYMLYDESLSSAEHNVAYSISKKITTVDEEQTTLIFVVLRGGGYGAEWASNFDVGISGDYSKGFDEASKIVYDHVTQYINNLSSDQSKNIKVLITGYSRSAAVANLTAARLNEWAMNNSRLQPLDIFAYTFATPNSVLESCVYKKLDKYGSIFYNNIHNIVNPADVVSRVPLSQWGFTKFGNTHYFSPYGLGLDPAKYRDRLYAVEKTFDSLNVKNSTIELNIETNYNYSVSANIIAECLNNITNVESRNGRANFYKTLRLPIQKALHVMNYKMPLTTDPDVWIDADLIDYLYSYYPTEKETIKKLYGDGGYCDTNFQMFIEVFDYQLESTFSDLVSLYGVIPYKPLLSDIKNYLYENKALIKGILAIYYLEIGNDDFHSVDEWVAMIVKGLCKTLFDVYTSYFSELGAIAGAIKGGAQGAITGKGIGGIAVGAVKGSAEDAIDIIKRTWTYLFEGSKSGVTTSHSPELYLAWMNTFSAAQMRGMFDKKYVAKYLQIACPVDVYFYDQDGVAVASVIGGTVTNNTDDISIKVINDVKSIQMSEQADYRIEIIPVAEGDMNVSVAYEDAYATEIEKVNFNNVTLSTSLEYELIAAEGADGKTVYQLLNSERDTVSDDTCIEGEIQTIRTQIDVIGNGNAVCKEYVSPGTYETLIAIPEVGNTFIGWYLNDKLISVNQAYSFFATQSQTYTAKFTVSNTGNETDGYTVTGTVTSSDSNTASEEDDTITIILANDEHSYTATVTSSGINSTVDYRIENVVAGTYTMTVSKANHVDRNYIVTVVSENVVQDVKICLLGDVTGDGNVNMKDWGRMRSHIVKTNVLTDYALACADVTKDGNVNMKDWGRMRSHIVKTQPLW